MSMEDLPEIAKFRIISFLDARSILRMASASKDWLDRISSDTTLWKQRYEVDFGCSGVENVDYKRECIVDFKLRHGLYRPRIVNLIGHTRPVNQVRSYGSVIVSASFDQTVRVWDLKTTTCLHVFPIKSFVWPLAMNGTTLVGGDCDGNIVKWNLTLGAVTDTWQGHVARVNEIHTDDRHVISGGIDGKVKIWDASTNGHLRTFVVDAFSCMHVDGDEIMCGSEDGIVHVFHREDGLLYNLQTQDNVRSICSNPIHIVLQKENAVEAWNRASHEHVKVLWRSDSVLSGVRCDRTKIFIWLLRERVVVLDAKTWRLIRSCRVSRHESVSYCYNAGSIVIGEFLGSIYVHDLC